MVLTPSEMLPLGTPLPAFALERAAGGRWETAALEAKPMLVLFICAHCPYVIHIEPELRQLFGEAERGHLHAGNLKALIRFSAF